MEGHISSSKHVMIGLSATQIVHNKRGANILEDYNKLRLLKFYTYIFLRVPSNSPFESCYDIMVVYIVGSDSAIHNQPKL